MLKKLNSIIINGTLKRYLTYKKTFYYRSVTENIKFRLYDNKNIILLEGHGDSLNVGDAINLPIVEYLSDKKVVLAKYISRDKTKNMTTYSVIGSILQWIPDNTHVWGSGFISNSDIHIPKNCTFFSVRGPNTRELLLKNSIIAPDCYGDPGLLLPLFYWPKVKKTVKVGILPHYIDKNHRIVKSYNNKPGFKTINIEVGTNYKKLVRQLLSCEVIVTSSLHGLIFANAYGIPVLWVNISDNITGGYFKYHDYLKSVELDFVEPVELEKNKSIEWFYSNAISEKAKINYIEILNSCPFANKDKKLKLTNIAKKVDAHDKP